MFSAAIEPRELLDGTGSRRAPGEHAVGRRRKITGISVDRGTDLVGKDDAAVEVATGSKNGPLPVGLRADDLAVYTIVSRVLLNLDETITKE